MSRTKAELLAAFLDERKATCPACDSTSSSVTAGFREDGKCPFCGLPREIVADILYARERGADAALTQQLAEQAKTIERQRDRLRTASYALDEIRGLIRDYDASTTGG